MIWHDIVLRWPSSAQIAIGALTFSLLLMTLLWLTGRRPWVGPLDITAVGSLGEWLASLGAAATVLTTAWLFFLTKKAERDHEERSEAMQVTSWTTWTDIAEPETGSPVGGGEVAGFRRARRVIMGANKAATSVGRVTIVNGTAGALFDWNVTVVPSRSGWTEYVRLSARVGQLPPGGRISIDVNDPPQGVTVRRHGPVVRVRSMPRFVVVAFTDAWGGGWIRVNGDLQRVPRESHFVPRLIHLRNPAMPWAGILDQADWSAFISAAGRNTDLPELLRDLLHEDARDYPWLGIDVRKQVAARVLACKLERRGRMGVPFPDRAVVRSLSRTASFRKTQAFFKLVNESDRGELLYLTQS